MKDTGRSHRAALLIKKKNWGLKVSQILISSLGRGTSRCPCPSYFFWPFCVWVYSDCLCPHHCPFYSCRWYCCFYCCCCWGHRWQSHYKAVVLHSFFFPLGVCVCVCVSVGPAWWFLTSFACVSMPPLSAPSFFFSTESVAVVVSLHSLPMPRTLFLTEKYMYALYLSPFAIDETGLFFSLWEII